jgi:hypothetical protein
MLWVEGLLVIIEGRSLTLLLTHLEDQVGGVHQERGRRSCQPEP